MHLNTLTRGNTRFLRQLAQYALEVKPPLGIISDFVLDKDTAGEPGLDLKKSGAIDVRSHITASFVFGSQELYDWINLNPRVRMRRTEVTNSSGNIGKQPQMMSINAALQVDLLDQANASRVRNKIYSGFGGSTDFIVGALHSRGGQSFMTLPSWHEKTNTSKIIPMVTEGGTSFQHSYVVTEQGMAECFGVSEEQQAKNIIYNAAHPNARKELFEAKQRDKKLFDRSYIDTKGSAKMKDGYKSSNTNDSNSMRYFVNKKLAEKNNPLWKEFIKIMNEHADLFADSLINIILKTKLFDELDSKDLGKYKFSFFLVTGVGDVSSKGEVKVGQASVIPLKTTLCGLTRIEEQFKNKKYEIVLDEQKKGSSDAAKIFLQLKRGNMILLDLEIRYKGAFTPQPQFQGTLNSDFKK